MRTLLTVLSVITSQAFVVSVPKAATATPLRVPACTAYLEPDPEPAGMEVSEQGGVTSWADRAVKVVWYGTLQTSGRLDLSLTLRLPEKNMATLRLTVGGQSRTGSAQGGTEPVTVDFGSVTIPAPGTYRFAVEGVTRRGATFGDVDALLLRGPAADGAHFSLAKTRGAPSVHLWYPTPKDAQISWFYNEVTVRTDPLWSYYMACGFSRGYFGIQVNSPTERRIIFSVWDAGSEPTDPAKVPREDRVQLLAKGLGVVSNPFGNEGTGGHSHLVYPWKTGHAYRFLVSAEPDGGATVYTGYFYFPETKRWGLIARFRAPKDGGYLRGLYSFNEDFNGANGQQRRLAEFSPQWAKTADGHWTELTTARFTHTADGVSERLDRTAGVTHGRFFLSNGGFVPTPQAKYGDTFTRSATGVPPDIHLPAAPDNPQTR